MNCLYKEIVRFFGLLLWVAFCVVFHSCQENGKGSSIRYEKGICVSEFNDTSYYVYPFIIEDTLFVVIPSYWNTDSLYIRGMSNAHQSSKLFLTKGTKGDQWNVVSVFCDRYYDLQSNSSSYGKIVFCQSKQNGIFVRTDKEMIEEVNNSADKLVEAKGKLKCFTKSGEVEYDGELVKIKGRGHWSWSHADKKPYKIKIKKKTPLLGLLPNKSFNLLSNPFDDSQIRNWIALHIAEEMGLPYPIHCEFCSLWTDGEYRGLYLLTETVHVGKGNVDITDVSKDLNVLSDETGGYILEADWYSSSKNSFKSKNGMPIDIKRPKEITDEQFSYIRNRYEEMMSAVTATDGYCPQNHKYYTEFMDISSFAKYYLCQELLYNVDAGWSSVFMFKDRDSIDSLFYAGPLWDMDATMRPWWGGKDDAQYKAYILKAGIVPFDNGYMTLFPELCAHPDFFQKVKDIYNEEVESVCHQYFNANKMDSLHQSLCTDIILNNMLWQGKKEDGKRAFRELLEFMGKRISFFDDDLKRDDYHTVVIDVNQNYPVHRHLMEWHLKDGEQLQLINAYAPRLVWDGCLDDEGNLYEERQIEVKKDMRLVYQYHQESIWETIKRKLKF